MSEQTVPMADKISMVAIGELKGWEKNPRRNDHVVDALADSIRRYGMNVPILINKNKMVIAGNTRLKACLQLGLKTVPCLLASHLSPQQQQAYNIADNKLASLSAWDDTLLLEALDSQKAILGEEFDPAHYGFTMPEYDLLAQGWQHDGNTDSIPEDSSEAPGRIVVTGPNEYVESAKTAIAKALANEGLDTYGFAVK